MSNRELAHALDRLADLLEIENENRFKVRAYRNAARTIRTTAPPLARLVEAGADLTQLPTIGRDIANVIRELVTTGQATRLSELERRMPATLADLTRIEGIGPKRAHLLFETLGIATVADLRAAIAQGRLRTVRGFGAKTEARIAKALERKVRPARLLLVDADLLVETLLEYMGRAPGLERVEAAGSWRRRQETVGDIDLLAVGHPAQPIMQHFLDAPWIETVELAGDTRATAVLESGTQVDLRVLPREAYGAALHYFTGSQGHNVALRRLALSHGLRISEYGVFRAATGEEAEVRVGGATEEEVFAAVGLPWIPPELREDRGEIEAAREGRLPRLVRLEDIRGDLHMHSTWSDGKDSIEAMARAALARGYEYIAIADHSPSIRIAGGIGPRELERQWQEIDALNETLPGIRIFKAMEVDILRDGALDLPDATLDRLDFAIASVHSAMRLPSHAMTERVLRALRHPAVRILGHPTGRLLEQREPYSLDLDAVFETAAQQDVALEINSLPKRLDLNDVLARRAHAAGVTIVINTDAHSTRALRFMQHGVAQARRAWLAPEHVLNVGTVDEVGGWLSRRGR